MATSQEDTEDVEDEHLLRKLLESIAEKSEHGGITENMAQLLAVALGQVSGEGGVSNDDVTYQEIDPVDNVDNTIEVPSSNEKQKTLGIKFSPDIRRKIINFRKGGKRYRDIAKELGASVSGVQKVWERFLMTGTIDDRKPSVPAGRPRKFPLREEEETELTVTTVTDPSNVTENYLDTSTTVPAPPTRAVLLSKGTNESVTEEPMDAPGAMVEVVATTTTPGNRSDTEGRRPRRKSVTPSYREELLLRLIKDCPLAEMRSSVTTNEHIVNLMSSTHKPLYMEYVLGHPFGRVPSPKPYEPDIEDSQVILCDPCNPLGKELLSGYTTKIYFNACCKPSPLFDKQLVLHSLPLSLGPGYIHDTLQALLQLLLDLTIQPWTVLDLIPDGSGPELRITGPNGKTLTKHFPVPDKLSQYWTEIYYYCQLFQCCENFLSATPPSAPCLLCHPFESFAANLLIQDETSTDMTQISDDLHIEESSPHDPLSTDDVTDGIQYVAYSGQTAANETTPTIIRRTPRKRTTSSITTSEITSNGDSPKRIRTS